VKAELVRGSDGIFDVVADGTRIFCKDEQDRFPTAPEILKALRQR
jgi:hypothetical protein